MTVPVESHPSFAARLPLWIIAAAISVVAIRYTFFAPCCLPQPQLAMKTLCFGRDSVVTIPGSGCDDYLDATAAFSMTAQNTLRIRARGADILIPAEGVIIKPR